VESAVKLPTKIEPTPLVEAVVDVRFLPRIPPAAVFGFVYGLIQESYGEFSSLPILQLPEQMRDHDPNLHFQPLYRMQNGPFVLQMGPRILNVAAIDSGYPGWSLFSAEVLRLFDILAHHGVIDSVTRVGMRYINYFAFNIFEFSNFSVTLMGTALTKEKVLLRVEFPDDNLVTVLQITNGGRVHGVAEAREGSIIDLDTYAVKPNFAGNMTEDFRSLIHAEHSIIKKRFFSGLKDEYLNSLNPHYD
jgi:uncharacterized protein (TIGR04255 family)